MQSRTTEGRSDDSSFWKKLVGACPTVKISINQSPLLATVDTGSQVSTVTESFFLDNLQGPLQIIPSKCFRLTAANGLVVPYIGYFLATVELNGQVLPDKGFLVIRDSSTTKSTAQCLLEMNILKEVNGLSSFIQPVKELVKDGRVRNLKSTSIIPARSIQMISVTGCDPRVPCDLMVQPLPVSFNPNLLLVPAVTFVERSIPSRNFQLV